MARVWTRFVWRWQVLTATGLLPQAGRLSTYAAMRSLASASLGTMLVVLLHSQSSQIKIAGFAHACAHMHHWHIIYCCLKVLQKQHQQKGRMGLMQVCLSQVQT